MKTTNAFRPLGKDTPATIRRFITPRIETLGPGITIHWATPRGERYAEGMAAIERSARLWRPTVRHPGLQCR